jgi:hypothetical protein
MDIKAKKPPECLACRKIPTADVLCHLIHSLRTILVSPRSSSRMLHDICTVGTLGDILEQILNQVSLVTPFNINMSLVSLQ